MFINQGIIAIIFKLVNFVALIGLVFFVFKKYVKHTILARISEKETSYQNLLLEQVALENEQQRLTSSIHQEKLQIQDFQNKIDEWKKKVTLQCQLQEQQSQVSFATIKKRNLAIALIQENTYTQNKIIDIVTTDLENHLSHYFKDPQKRNAYMASIIGFMNQRIS